MTTVAVVLIMAANGTLQGQEVRLAEIIENVRRNEALYGDLDVAMHTLYDIGDRKPIIFKSARTEIIRIDVDTHFVSQDGKFRLQVTEKSTDIKGEKVGGKTRVFDGRRTQALDGSVANVMEYRSEDSQFVRPHMLLLRSTRVGVPLSTYLQGYAAIREVQGKQWNADSSSEVSYLGTAEFQSLHCHRVALTEYVQGESEPNNRRELWLAEERNYLPVRLLSWTFRHSKETPILDGSVDELREVKPGIWFPILTHVSRYDSGMLKREGAQRLQWKEEYVVKDVSLDPDYDMAFFRELTLPERTAVYEVQGDDIVKSYRVGAPDGPDGPDGARIDRFRYGWMILASVAVIVLVTAAVLLLRSSKSQGGTASGSGQS
jgi:hypothetical protein